MWTVRSGRVGTRSSRCLSLRWTGGVRALESRIKNLSVDKPQKKTDKGGETKLSADLKAVETALREKLGVKVKLAGTAEKGKLVIEYFSKDDLSNIYDAIIGE